MDVDRKGSDLLERQDAAPGRHQSMAPVIDAVVKILRSATIDPDVEGEVGRPIITVSLQVGRVTVATARPRLIGEPLSLIGGLRLVWPVIDLEQVLHQVPDFAGSEYGTA